MRILTTRFRTRAVKEDTRAEVRAKEEQIHQLTHQNAEIQKQLEVATQNTQLLAKLETPPKVGAPVVVDFKYVCGFEPWTLFQIPTL